MDRDKTVAFTVIRRLPIGLLVRLENGAEGIIRVRETSWDADDRRRWQELYPENWSSRAVILSDRKGKNLELSMRLATRDPWDGVPGRYRRGQIISGIVSGVMNYGVFVDISAGVTGLLHVSEIPGQARANPLELFWPGDHLLVSIVSIDLTRRRISLGMPATHPGAAAVEAQPTARPATAGAEPPERPAGAQTSIDRLVQAAGARKKHILVIEDDEDQAATLSNWFARVGHRVDVRNRGHDGLLAAEQDPPDIAVVDLTLPDMLGVHALRAILERRPECRGIIITDWAKADEHVRELEALQAGGVAFLLKPILPNDLVEILRAEEAPAKATPAPPAAPPAASRPGAGRARPQAQQALKTALLGPLKECQETLKFDLAALFALDPVQRTVELVCSSGEPSAAALVNPAGAASLVFSPVRDAAEDGDAILLETLREHDIGRFRYLLEFFPLEACLGVRVPSSVSKRYALFLFHGQPKPIAAESVVFARGIGLAIGAQLDRQMFQEHAILVQRTALLGHLTRGLVHEINHQMGPLDLTIDAIEAILGEMKCDIGAHDKPRQALEANIDSAIEQVSEMHRSVMTMMNTTRQFGRMITHTKEEFLRIDEPIENAIKLLREISDRAKVRVTFQAPKALTLVRSQGAVIEQVLINILLNAIQQIGLHPHEPGWVQVRVEIRRADDGEKIRILVEDNGPGIHLRQWEQIFDVGYTTREDGSGMGLYISRSLLEALGGKLYVEESYIMGGSIFALEIPSNV